MRSAEKLGPKVEIYIDAIDIFAEDYAAAGALALVRGLLRQIKGNKGELDFHCALSASCILLHAR